MKGSAVSQLKIFKYKDPGETLPNFTLICSLNFLTSLLKIVDCSLPQTLTIYPTGINSWLASLMELAHHCFFYRSEGVPIFFWVFLLNFCIAWPNRNNSIIYSAMELKETFWHVFISFNSHNNLCWYIG